MMRKYLVAFLSALLWPLAAGAQPAGTPSLSSVGVGLAAPSAGNVNISGSYQVNGVATFNVLSYGADPTGVADSAAAINNTITAANASGGCVYLPAGTYYVKSAAITNPPCLRGDGMTESIIKVDSAFSTSALGVLVFSGSAPGPGNADVYPEVHDLGFTFAQPTGVSTTANAAFAIGVSSITVASVPTGAISGNLVFDSTTNAAMAPGTTGTISGTTITLNHATIGAIANGDAITFGSARAQYAALGTCTTTAAGTGCKYPPAIYYAITGGRNVFQNIQINAAWDGIKCVGNSCAGWWRGLSIGALDRAMWLAAAQDWVNIDGFESWPFGLAAGTGPFEVFLDGGQYALEADGTEGLIINNINDLGGQILFSTGGWEEISNVSLDSGGTITDNSGWMLISNLYYTPYNFTTGCVITSGASTHSIVHDVIINEGAVPAFCVSGSVPYQQVSGGEVIGSTTVNDVAIATIAGTSATARYENLFIAQGTEDTSSVLFKDTSDNASELKISGVTSPGGEGAFATIATDGARKTILGNNFGSTSFTTPGMAGAYAPNGNFIVVPPDASNTSIGMGQYAMYLQPSGSFYNTAIGWGTLAGAETTAATGNSAFGAQAGDAITSGADNVFFGENAGLVTTTGNNNIFIGQGAGQTNVSGSGSTAIGEAAGAIMTGAPNTIIGQAVGSTVLTTGSSNILIGTSNAVTTPAAATTNYLDIGNLLAGDTSKDIVVVNQGANQPTLSSCGTTPTVGTGSGNMHGSITEGTSAAGCTVTFKNAFHAAPDCVASTSTGLASFAYTVSTSALTVTNTSASNGKFSYVCVEGVLTP